jgi:hypothetical protein
MNSIKIIIVLIAIVSTLTAQEQPAKIKEYGIGLTSVNNFSLQYRWGNEKRLFRLSGNIGAQSSSDNSNGSSYATKDTLSNTGTASTKRTTPLSLNCGLNFSVLKLKSLNEHFGILCGSQTGITYINSVSQNNQTSTSVNNTGTTNTDNLTSKINSQRLQPYVGIVIGAFYKINSSFILYGEVVPNIFYAFTKTTTTMNQTSSLRNSSYASTNTDSGNNYGVANISNSGAMLTIVYRMTK